MLNGQPCADCNDIGWVRGDYPLGDPRYGKLIRCGCKSDADLQRLQRLSGLTEAERQVRLDDIVARKGSDTERMVDAAKQFVKEPYGFLTVHGGTGNAKTTALQGIVNELVAMRVQAVYITAFDLIGYIRAAFAKDDNGRSVVADDDAHARLKKLENVRVLCLDEMDKVKWSDWVQEQLTDLIDVRYRTGLGMETGTVFAMNANPSVLPPWMQSRLQDGRNVLIENRDADVRPGMEK